MNEIYLTIIISTIVLLIEFYSETHLKNYGALWERTLYLFGIKTIFNLTKSAMLISFIYVIFELNNTQFSEHFLNNNIFNIKYEKIGWYLLPTGAITILIIFSNSRELFHQLQIWNLQNSRFNQLVANLKYVFFRLISFSFSFFILSLTLRNIIHLNAFFIENGMILFDWIKIETNIVNNYYKGTYFSLLIAICAFFLFNNAFLKLNSSSLNFREIRLDFFKYFFISLFLTIGLFFGLFSILNGYYNLNNSGFSEWISKENIVGILPIRISSILIVYYLISYIYKEVINERLLQFIVLGILPIRKLKNYYANIEFERRETLFFCQISFYVINIGLAEYFLIIEIKNIYLSILNFAILFILDDFKIINDYSRGLFEVLRSHFFRLWFFNLLMIIVAIIFLAITKHYIMLLIYLTGTILLFRYYFKNYSLIRYR